MFQVIEQAKRDQTPIYTIGIGDPGKNELVTTVLVLDHSGSMADKAADGDDKPKIEALREAASRFVELMRPTAKTTLLPFSSDIQKPQPFSANKETLMRDIKELQPDGGTLLYDATWYGVETLAAARLPGKKAVVVLTDGVDESPGSRRTDQDVIDAANAAGVRAVHARPGPDRGDQRAGHARKWPSRPAASISTRKTNKSSTRYSRSCRSTCTTTASTKRRWGRWRNRPAASTIPAATYRNCR